MTTPAEKDAMALAVLDRIGTAPISETERGQVAEARAHLASRIAELEETREVLFGGLDRDRDNITTRNLAVVAINALARERDRATRAEAELAALKPNAERYVWLRDRWGRIGETYHGTTSKIAEMTDDSQGWEVDPESLDRAIDAARGEGE